MSSEFQEGAFSTSIVKNSHFRNGLDTKGPAHSLQPSNTPGINVNTTFGKITLIPKSIASITSIAISSYTPSGFYSSSGTTRRSRSATCSSKSSSSSEDSLSSYTSSSGSSIEQSEEENEEAGRTSLLGHLISGPNLAARQRSVLQDSQTARPSKPRAQIARRTRSSTTTNTQQSKALEVQRATTRTYSTYSLCYGGGAEGMYYPSPWGNDPRPRDADLVQKAKSNVVNWLKSWRKSREMLEFEERLKSWDEMKRREGGWY